MYGVYKTVAVSALMVLASFSAAAQNAEPVQEPILEPTAVARERTLLKNFYYLNHHSVEMVFSDTLLIEDGIITAFDTTEADCVGCNVIDLGGGYLIPGLMDLHQHLNNGGFIKQTPAQKASLLRSNLYWGITTVYNPNIKLPLLRSVRAAVLKNPKNYPEFFAAGQNIGIKGGWGDLSVSNFQEFKNAATRQLAAGANNIKVSMDDMSWLSSKPLAQFPEKLLKQAAVLMHSNGHRLFLHASQRKDVEAAIRVNVDGILHGTVDAPLSQKTMNMLVGKRMGYISTLALSETMSDVRSAVKQMRSYDPDLINGAVLYDNMGSELMAMNWLDWWDQSNLLKAKLPILRGNTLALVKAGGLVGIGTDAGTPSIILGASLPYEMHLHEQIGLHPLAVIKMASYNNARILRIDSRTGSIQEGKEADLVFMRANPASGIKALNSAEWTMQNGSITFRQELSTGK